MPAVNKISSVEFQRELMKRRTESQVQAEITAYLRRSGRPFTITDASLSFNANGKRVMRVAEGWPDITTITKTGKLFAIEVKRPYRGVLSYEQAKCLIRLGDWGATICVARSLEDVIVTEETGICGAMQEIYDALNKAPRQRKAYFERAR